MDNLDKEINVTKEELVLILDNIFGNVFVVNSDGRLIFQNKQSAEVLGFTRDQLLGKSVRELLEKGITKRSITEEALKKGETVVGLASNSNDLGLATISKPVFDQDDNLLMVVTYSQEMPLLDMFAETINRERQENIKYRQALEYLGSEKIRNKSIIISNPKMKEVYNTAEQVAKTNSTIIIYGESGAGKEVVTSFIHKHSLRSKEPLIPVNCAAIPRELMESEFFGYVRGAFTGANKEGKPGLFELANKGTLFLDEIAELPLNMQAKLLRVLETGEIIRLGSTGQPKKMDVRIIAATNKDLQKMVTDKLFREDLFYRLNVIPITIPPLRERKDELPLLANCFLDEYNRKYSLHKSFSPDLMEDFIRYRWPGNIRELRNVIERLALTSDSDILRQHIGIGNEDVNRNEKKNEVSHAAFPDELYKLKEVIDAYEEEYIRYALKRCKGNVAKASKKLEIHRSVIYKKLKKWQSNSSL